MQKCMSSEDKLKYREYMGISGKGYGNISVERALLDLSGLYNFPFEENEFSREAIKDFKKRQEKKNNNNN